MSIGVVVMAHPARQENAERLGSKLSCEVVYDKEGPPSADTRRRWRTTSKAWRAVEDLGKDWSLVIQDDALVANDLVAGLERGVKNFPNGALISPYLGMGRPDQVKVHQEIHKAWMNRTPWLSLRSLNWGVALLVPTETVDHMVRWCSNERWNNNNSDHRIGLYYRDYMMWRTWHIQPSPVDHIDGESLIGHDNPLHKRVAWNFIGERESALTIDWAKAPPGGFDHIVPGGWQPSMAYAKEMRV